MAMARTSRNDGTAVAHCACAISDHVGPGGRAVSMDPAAKEASLKRLRRIEGQLRGLQHMVEEGRYCADILTQIASVHEALRGVGRGLMRNHLKHCATTAIRSGGEKADAMYEELLDLMYRHAR
jgi:CsoR family transcriptional regulator, copper-sensing transcriptional repressor